MNYELTSAYKPTGDQPEAIAQLTEGVLQGVPAQTLLGVTGSGKTFTIANVIANINKPTLILSHNKTLAAQLYGEFKGFFPNNAVEYYVSYYDYYQPEAYLPSSDTYIEKDLAINDEIDKLRLAATSALLSGRKDVVVVSSVSCIYGMGNPSDFYKNVIEIERGRMIDRNVFLRRLVDSLYVRNDIDLNRGNFRVKGDTVDIYLAYTDNLLRVTFWGDEIDGIEEVDPITGVTIAPFDAYKIYPANLFMTTKEATLRAIHEIEDDLTKQVAFFESIGKEYEAKRLYERVTYDMEMIRELGHCSGIENYSRYFAGGFALRRCQNSIRQYSAVLKREFRTQFPLFPLDGFGSAVLSFRLHPVFGAVSNRVSPGDTLSRFVGFGDKSWDNFKNFFQTQGFEFLFLSQRSFRP